MPTDPLAQTLTAPEASGGRTIVGARYELISLLGTGGMGNVYKARDLELDELIALKILRRDVASAPGALERFRREVKLARRVTHPNVARVFDIGDLTDEKILTMELVDGEPLSALLEREGALPVPRTIDIASAICAGVGAAHAAGVVHRDLKPDNVMLANDGRVVVTDFGIARAARADAQRTFGGFVGTPAYMAPEQVEGGDVDERADVFAFGAMLYEMLTGAHPWRGESPFVVAAARLLHPAADPRSLRADLSARLAELVMRCLARHRESRPATMQEIAGVLATITEPRGEPRRVSLPPRPDPSLAVTSAKRVAVLPFANLGAPEHAYIADGLTDDLIDALSVARDLRVHSRGVVRAYKGTERDARQIGRDLDVQVVVEGSVRKTAGAFRISARVISVADGVQLWAKHFDGDETEMLRLNDEVARSIAAALTADIETVAGRATDGEAADLYLRARLAYHTQFMPQMASVTALFERAMARAPDDPRIIAGYVMAHASHADGSDVPRLRALVERALRVAPSLPDAHVALGVLFYHTMHVADAMQPLRRALRIAPSNADAHDVLGLALEYADDPDALRHLETTRALEPTSARTIVNIVRHHALAGDWDRADAAWVGSAGADAALIFTSRARMAMWQRDAAAAAELRGKVVDERTDSLVIAWPRMMLDLVLGKPLPSHAFRDPPSVGPWVKCLIAEFRAECAAYQGDVDGALSAIEAADPSGFFDVAWLDRCPLLGPVRSHPRFTAIRSSAEARAAAIRAAYALT